jgi:glutathione-regulated potassium-efflux system ancillary protein KefC
MTPANAPTREQEYVMVGHRPAAAMMSTGLTFGTISALFGLSHGIIDQAQYSVLVATVIGSAVIPTLIANAFYLPRHLVPRFGSEEEQAAERPTALAASDR